MVSLLIFLFILSILILVHEFGHFIIAKKIGVKVEQFSLGFGPALFKKKKKNTEYSINLLPLGGFVKLAGDNLEDYTGKPDEYFSQKPGKRFWIIFFGPLLNYFLGFLFFWLICFIGYPTFTTKVGGLIDGFGAQESGIKVGDKITAIDGKKVEYWEELQKIVYVKRSEDYVKVSLARGNSNLTLPVRIHERHVEDQVGQKRRLGLLGITPFDEVVTVKHGFLPSFLLAFHKTKDLTVMTYRALGFLATGRLSMRESMTGPLGIFFITSKAARLGFIAVLHLMAVLSLSLAIFNLLPLPILDGGHIVFLALEKIRGKHLSIRMDKAINKVGVTFIMFLAIFVTYNDIVRNFGNKIYNFFIK
ncbi:MAG: RIP metalloprotease RseP [Candidatus Omnitrophica bacterium]|nr:RIP metalloprotease RseP [Candidatus Omnitrophota bacterium]